MPGRRKDDMKTMFSILRESARGKNGYFDGLEIRTKSGANHRGSLVKWKPDDSPQIACLVDDRNQLTYVEIESIESVQIVNPA